MRRIFERLRDNEGALKREVRWKLAALIAREAAERRGGHSPREAWEGARQAQDISGRVRGVQRAIEGKAKEYGVPVIRINPRDTSGVCPMHGAEIIYSGRDRRGTCSEGGEVMAQGRGSAYNLLSRAPGGDGGDGRCPEPPEVGSRGWGPLAVGPDGRPWAQSDCP
ncbi:MAG: zinc ribbon domain-containing protein [Nitrososphaeria archaeon]